MSRLGSHGLSEILDRVPDAVIAVNRHWEIIFLNATAAALTGKHAEDLLDSVLWDSFSGLRGTEFEHRGRMAMIVGGKVSVEEFIEPFGFWAEIEAFPAGGELTIYLRDRTERRKVDELSLYQDALLNSVRRAVIGTDAAGIVKFWNQAAERLYGWSAPEAVGKNILDLTPAEMSRAQAEDIIKTIQNGERWQGEFPVRKKDGSLFNAHVTDTPIFDKKKQFVGIVGVSYDLDDTPDNIWG